MTYPGSSFLFFLVEDNGKTSLTHHLPRDFGRSCFFVSASGLACRLVVGDSTSSKIVNGFSLKKFVYRYFNKVGAKRFVDDTFA